MIVPSMSPFEVYENLAADDSKIKFKRQQSEPKIIKKIIKAAKFPALELIEYKIPSSQNSYILYFYAESRQDAEKPVFGVYSIVFDRKERYVVKWGRYPYQYTPSDPYIITPKIDVYPSHFFERYKERALRNPKISTNEVICIYFIRNPDAIPIKLNEEIKRDYQKYGELGGYGLKVQDGVCLLSIGIVGYFDEADRKEKVNAVGCIYGTFLSHDMLKSSQNVAIRKEMTVSLRDFFKDKIIELKA